MGDTLGVLKVSVIRGNRLAVRDFTSSDPYVIITLGNQEVFDRDFLKYDDKMGHAFLDIQPIVSSSGLKRALNLNAGETKLRKVAASADNCLLEDSFIVCNNGEIVQDVRLRLCAVETGELVVKIKFMENF